MTKIWLLLLVVGAVHAQDGPLTRVQGRIVWEGDLPEPVLLDVTRHPHLLGLGPSRPRVDGERLVVDPETRGVAWCVVWLDGVEAGEREPARASIGFDGFRLQPHVVLVPAGQLLTLSNADEHLHSPHPRNLAGETVFGLAMPTAGAKERVRLHEPGPIQVLCDVGHTWESGWIYVTPHELYAVTDAQGRFDLGAVTDGTYVLRGWHEGWQIEEERRTKTGELTGYTFSDPIALGPWTITVRGGLVEGLPETLPLLPR